MPRTPSHPENLLRKNRSLPTYNDLAAQNASLMEQIYQLREEMQELRDEIARLKKQKPKPDIGPSKMTKKKKGSGKKRKRKKKPSVQPDKTEVVKAKNVPAGSEFKGYSNFFVQELVIRSVTTCYKREKWLTPQGNMLTAELSHESSMPHFGPTLCSFILYQYYHAQVTEPLILEQLREWGIRISSGQLHRMITERKETFRQEKDEILRVGLRVSGHVHVDDTGARHRGQNGYCTHIGNEWFAWFESTKSKSRVNFFELLRTGRSDYLLSGEALEYMAAQGLAKKSLELMAPSLGRVFEDKPQWQAFLQQHGISVHRQVRIATEGALLGVVLDNGINPDLVIVSDDAPQFRVLLHALCWIHAERVLARLIGFNDPQREALDEVRGTVWSLYRDIKSYQENPTPQVKLALGKRFDELCQTQTCFTTLNKALKRMGRNRTELLLALERPDLPLHNNLSEGDIREYVKRRKISGGTRSEDGRQGRDTFASLKKTCRKLKVSFWEYLNDRIRSQGRIPQLPRLIEAQAGAT